MSISSSNCLVCYSSFESKISPDPKNVTNVFEVYCRLLKIKLASLVHWDFTEEGLPFCDYCISTVEKVSDLQNQLESIEKAIKNILYKTKLNILKSRNLVFKREGGSLHGRRKPEDSFIDRVDFFRYQAVREFDPDVEVWKNNFLCELVEVESLEPQSAVNAKRSLRASQNKIQTQKNISPTMNNIPAAKPKAKKRRRRNPFLQKRRKRKGTSKKSVMYRGIMINFKDGLYHCGKCGRSLKLKDSIKSHIKISHYDRSAAYFCRYCNKSFGLECLLNRHERSHQSTRTFKCELCGDSFKHSTNLCRHRKAAHQGVKPYKCDYCSKQFYTQQDALEHSWIHTGEKPHECKQHGCGKRFRMLSHLKLHGRSHRGQQGSKRFKCNDCEETFDWPWILKKHTEEFHKSKEVENAEHIKKVLESKYPHLSVHPEDQVKPSAGSSTLSKVEVLKKPNISKNSSLNLKSSGEYNENLSFEDTEDPLLYGLVVDPSFKVEAQLGTDENSLEPELTDQDQSPDANDNDLPDHPKKSLVSLPSGFRDASRYNCKYCDNSYLHKFQLQRHEKTHKEYSKFYKCEHCGLNFSSRSGVYRHRKKLHRGLVSRSIRKEDHHSVLSSANFRILRGARNKSIEINTEDTLVKPGNTNPIKFKCKVCYKTFALQIQLNRHERLHQGRLYHCDVCNVSFRHSSNLSRHKKNFHRGLKPFQCNYCKKQFQTEEARVDHVRLHTGEKPHECQSIGCKRTFRTSALLQNHEESMHQSNLLNNTTTNSNSIEEGEEEEDILESDSSDINTQSATEELESTIRITNTQTTGNTYSVVQRSVKRETREEVNHEFSENPAATAVNQEEDDNDPFFENNDQNINTNEFYQEEIQNGEMNEFYEVQNGEGELNDFYQRGNQNGRGGGGMNEFYQGANVAVENRAETINHFYQQGGTQHEEVNQYYHHQEDQVQNEEASGEFYQEEEDGLQIEEVGQFYQNEVQTQGSSSSGFGENTVPNYRGPHMFEQSFKREVDPTEDESNDDEPNVIWEESDSGENGGGQVYYNNSTSGKPNAGSTMYRGVEIKFMAGSNMYQCGICDHALKMRSSLKCHIRNVHYASSSAYKCRYCSKTFGVKYFMTEHERTHFDVKDYKCVLCTAEFKQRKSLRNHVNRVHQGSQPFQCSVCHKQFLTQKDNMEHMRLHTGEKPFVCKFQDCYKSYRSASHLLTHEQVCHGEININECEQEGAGSSSQFLQSDYPELIINAVEEEDSPSSPERNEEDQPTWSHSVNYNY